MGVWPIAPCIMTALVCAACAGRISGANEVAVGATDGDAALARDGRVNDADAAASPTNAPDASSTLDASDAGLLDATEAPDTSPMTATSGVLDTTFGGTGFVTRSGTASPVNGQPDDIAYAVAVDSQRRVLIGGASYASIYHRAVVWRLDAGGAFDATFGTGGAWIAPAQNNPTVVSSVDVDEDRPLFTGNGWRPADAGAGASSTWRLTTTGVPDTSFGGSGQLFASADTGTTLGSAIRRDAFGTLVVAGWHNFGNGTSRAMLWRTSVGSPFTWNASELALASGTTSWGGDRAQALAIEPSGRIVIGGTTKSASIDTSAALWRTKSDGSADVSFGGAGHVKLKDLGGNTSAGFSSDVLRSVAVDSASRILFSGTTLGMSGQPRAFVARLDPSGTLDATFGQAGIVIFDTPVAASATNARGMALDSKGRIVVAGATPQIGTGLPAAVATVWRLTSDGELDASFGNSGCATISVPGYLNTFSAAVAVDATDHVVVAGTASPFGNSRSDLLVFRLTP